jgi:Zn-dependent peptidase ImmA (M78 family)
LKHGFKAEAERQANSLRQALSLDSSSSLIGTKLAKYLEVRVSSAECIPRIPDEIRQQLWEADSKSWSAFTIDHEVKGKHVFYNPTHSRGRHESNVMHELSHLICKHPPSKFISFENCSFALRTCYIEQEEEADWLGACLKLPRESLIWAVKQGMNNSQIADHFVTSFDMVQFRRNVTGIDKQLKAWKKF